MKTPLLYRGGVGVGAVIQTPRHPDNPHPRPLP